MSPSRVLVALLVLFAAFAAGAAPAGATSRDALMKTSLVALQCAIEKTGAAHMYVYPRQSAVRPGGGLPTPFWPRDPWTGRRLRPGTTRGHYIYERAQDRRSYRLTGYLSGGRTFVVRGKMAYTPMLAYDHRGREGLSLIFEYVQRWARSHDGRLPAASQVERSGSVGLLRRGGLRWPSNPWDHGAMEQRDDRGSFSYVRSDDGTTFTLRLHQSLNEGDFVLRGTATRILAGDRH